VKRRAPFAGLLSAYVVSVAGTAMSAIAIPWLVLTTTGSPTWTGIVGFATMAPYVTSQLLAGPVVDRVGLRRSFVTGNSAAAVLVALIPLLSALHQLSMAALLVVVALAGAVRGAADCASSALVPATATHGGIPMERAAGLLSGANRSALLLGAPLAGALVSLVGPASVVAIDAASFAAAALIALGWVRVAQPAAVAVTEGVDATEGSVLRRYGRDLAAGLRFIAGDRLLLGIITMVATTNLLDQGLMDVMLPVWVRDNIGSAGALGLIGGVGGLGSVLGNLVGAWLGPRVSRRALYTVGYLVGGFPRFLVMVLSGALAPVLVVTFVADGFAGSLNSVIGAASYERIPEHLRARVLGAVRASSWAGIPFGALLAGYAVDGLGLSPAVLTFGIAYLLTTLSPLVFPAWQQLRRPDPAPPVTRTVPA
jgi:MFS family permease